VTLGQKLQKARASRDAAKDALTSRVDVLREDLEARGIGGRIADKVTADAADAAYEVVDVVRSNLPVVAGTLLALIVWVFRHPILALFHKAIGDDDYDPQDDDEKEWNS
jgi:hypothetical protein